ncbi:MAG TPA: hypothetical protein VF574_17205 [Allosphingosinicella sp.]|jgi:hypothetical protein
MTSTTSWEATNASGTAPPALTRNGENFFARGVCYSPVPWGGNSNWVPYGDFMFPPWNGIWERDLPAMRACGINMIRTYNIQNVANGNPQDHSEFLDACWNGGVDPIYVLVGFGALNNLATFTPWDTSKAARDAAGAAFLDMAAAYGGFPAVMGFILGNEVNNPETIANPDFWAWIDALAISTKSAAPGKLTMMALVDDSMNSVKAGDSRMPNLDLWGINSYRGLVDPPSSNNFDNLWPAFAAASAKPLILTEWGAPASSHDADGNLVFTGDVVDNLDTYVAGHYADTVFNSVTTTGNGGTANPNAVFWAPVCAGSAYFEWTDEWWKLDADYSKIKCPATVQNPGTRTNVAFPGGWDDEECFGLNAIQPVDPAGRSVPTPGGCPGPWDFESNAPYPPDVLVPRQSLATLSKLWKSS